jgi:hypothetical protein
MWDGCNKGVVAYSDTVYCFCENVEWPQNPRRRRAKDP